MRVAFTALAMATGTAVAGRLFDRPTIVCMALIAYAAGLIGIAALLPVYSRKRLSWAGPRAVQLLAGLAWWAAMTAALGIAAARVEDDRPILQALVLGGLAQVLVASLAYLGPVLRGGAPHELGAGFALTRSWVSVVALNVAAGAALFGHGGLIVAGLAAWLGDFVARAVRLLSNIQEKRCGV